MPISIDVFFDDWNTISLGDKIAVIDWDLIGLSLPVLAVNSFLDFTKSCPVRTADMPVPDARSIGADCFGEAMAAGLMAGRNACSVMNVRSTSSCADFSPESEPNQDVSPF